MWVMDGSASLGETLFTRSLSFAAGVRIPKLDLLFSGTTDQVLDSRCDYELNWVNKKYVFESVSFGPFQVHQ